MLKSLSLEARQDIKTLHVSIRPRGLAAAPPTASFVKPVWMSRPTTRILSGPFITRVPFFLLFGFNKGIRK